MAGPRIEPTFGGGPPPLPPAGGYAFVGSDPVSIREAHIRHERLLKSAALLFGLGALVSLFVLGTSAYLVATAPDAPPSLVPMMLLFTVVLAVCGTLAYGYRTLKPWVKYVGTPVSCIGLLGVPVGTLLHGYILYLVWCEQGRRILQPDYAAIIRSTPQVRYKATTGDKVAMALLAALILGGVAMILLAL